MASEAGDKPQHKDLVREEFTRQANEYAVAPMIRDLDHIERLVNAVGPSPDARVLEVATGNTDAPGRPEIRLLATNRLDWAAALVALGYR